MRRNPLLLGLMVILSGLSCATHSALAAVDTNFADYRGIWIDRFDYRNLGTSGVQQIMANCAAAGFTDVIFQVRGQGDAYYQSNYEPRAEALSGSWDPLQVAVDAAHANGLKIHAWMNSMPLWNGTTPPSTTTAIEHPFYHDPSYRVMDLNGNYQPLQSGYVIANPINPDWQTHMNNVAGDIVANYNVDGLHLDYIRYVGSIDHASLPHDPQSHAMFLAATGLDAANPANEAAYQQYIRGRITDLVGDIRTTIKAINPDVTYSAAVWRDPDVGSTYYLQDYRTWLENDLLDNAHPMIYLHESNNYLLEPNINNTMSINTNTQVMPGLGPYLHEVYGDSTDLITQQLQTIYDAGANGSVMYDYGHLFKNTTYTNTQLSNIMNFIDSTVVEEPPVGGEIVVLDDFEVDEGHFSASPTYSGSNRGILSATAERDTSEAHTGIASERIDVEFDPSATDRMLRFLSGIGDPAQNVVIDADGWIGFWMMTETPGLTVQIALDDPDSADRGLAQEVIADGEWHLYQWDLDNNAQWEGWAYQDGIITGPTITIDSIFLFGSGSATVYLDDVAYNNGGSLIPGGLPGDLNGDGWVGLDDLDIILAHWNQTVTPGDLLSGDANGDGFVGLEDLDYVLGPWNTGTPPSGSVIPEPTTLALLGFGLLAFNRRRSAA